MLAICAGVRLEICVDARPGVAARSVALIVVPAICGTETWGGARAWPVARIVVPAICGTRAWGAKAPGGTPACGVAIVVVDVGCGRRVPGGATLRRSGLTTIVPLAPG